MATKTMEKYWHDRTFMYSNIENMELPGDRKWEKAVICVKGTEQKQKFDIQLIKDGSEKLLDKSYSLKKGEERSVEVTVQDNCQLSVHGSLSTCPFPPAAGEVRLTGYYEKIDFKTVTRSWSDSTGGVSIFENLTLPADHIWDNVTVTFTGKQSKSTGINVALIVDGSLENFPGHPNNWIVLQGTESGSVKFPLNKKAMLVVSGYITNHALTGGGADVTMTAYYKEGE